MYETSSVCLFIQLIPTYEMSRFDWFIYLINPVIIISSIPHLYKLLTQLVLRRALNIKNFPPRETAY